MKPVHIVVMGVAGTGKTTVGQEVANTFGLPMAEGDDFHSEANRAKMGAGQPLTDEDRWPWLRSLRDWMSERASEGVSTVVACSALRKAYRDILRESQGEVFFIHLVLPEDENLERLKKRSGHYMKPSMLDSQLATLEPLADTEQGIEVLNQGEPRDVVVTVTQALRDRFPALGE
ncbi:MAG: gluconokinase [Propionibacteriaceae bacterium]|nr:gluconokinase [Propionibacteriaceae bacterium]